MMRNELILIISHIGFILWFYVGYRFGKTKTKKRWVKKNSQKDNTILPKKNTWFIEGTECLYVEHLYDDLGIFEGKIELEDTTTKTRWKEYNEGDIIDDREACLYEEFKPKQR